MKITLTDMEVREALYQALNNKVSIHFGPSKCPKDNCYLIVGGEEIEIEDKMIFTCDFGD